MLIATANVSLAMDWLLVLTAVLLLSYYFLLRPQLYWQKRHVLQEPPIPILGDNLWTVLGMESHAEMVKRIYSRGKGARYVGMYQATLPTLLLRDPELIKLIAVRDFDHFTDRRSLMPEGVDPLWSRGLLQLRGDHWRKMRAILSPTFTASKMRNIFGLMTQSTQAFVNFFMQKHEAVIEVDLRDSLTRYATDIVGNCLLGITVDSHRQPNNEIYMHGIQLTNFNGVLFTLKLLLNVMLPSLSKALKLPLLISSSADFFKQLVHDMMTLREKEHNLRPDMINLMMEARRSSLEYRQSVNVDMAAQVISIFFAGVDTTSAMMSLCCYEIAVNLEVQTKLRQEIDKTRNQCDGKLTHEALGSMVYMDMVVSESLRKLPPSVVIERVCTKAYTIPPEKVGEHAVELKPGDVLWLPVIGLHHDEEYFPEPEKFDPERFSQENKALIKPYTYLPFGLGPRSCIASRFALMEVKMLLFYTLAHFELTVVKNTTSSMQFAKRTFSASIAGGHRVRFTKRLTTNHQ